MVAHCAPRPQNLVSDVHMLCTSRSRQRRHLLKSTARWRELHHIVPRPPQLPRDIHDAIRRAFHRNHALLTLSGLLAGFDLDLLDRSEWGTTWWVIGEVCEDALGQMRTDNGRTRAWPALAWSAVARAMLLVVALVSTGDAKGTYPSMTQKQREAMFDIRFKWTQSVASRRPDAKASSFPEPRHRAFLSAERELQQRSASPSLYNC